MASADFPGSPEFESVHVVRLPDSTTWTSAPITMRGKAWRGEEGVTDPVLVEAPAGSVITIEKRIAADSEPTDG